MGEHIYKTNINKIIILQKSSIRIIHEVPYNTSTNALFKSSKILKLHDVVNLETLKFLYKHKLGLLPNIFSDFLTTVDSNTRQANTYIIPKHRTNYRSFSLQITAPKVYNSFKFLHNITFTNLKSFIKYYTNTIISNY